MSESAASLIGVSKNFGEIEAVAELDLCIPRGKLVALLGRNGAGKTTAINLMLGLLKPSRGKVEVLGGNPNSIAIRQQLSAMLQHAELHEQLTVREYLRLFQSYFPKPLSVNQVCRDTQLESIIDRRYKALSGGQKRRVLLGLALVGDPQFLLLDEPTTGLDIDARRLLWDLVRRIVKEGKTVLLTTHYLEEADALADQVEVIDQGSIIFSGTPSEVKSEFSRSVIRCRTSLSPESLRVRDGVEEVKTSGGYVELHTHRPEQVLRSLLQQDTQLKDLSVTQARLEDAFLALTESKEAA
ncbi:MAG: ABC transporter ATP-binding protein [Pseudomonadota bacterium]